MPPDRFSWPRGFSMGNSWFVKSSNFRVILYASNYKFVASSQLIEVNCVTLGGYQVDCIGMA